MTGNRQANGTAHAAAKKTQGITDIIARFEHLRCGNHIPAPCLQRGSLLEIALAFSAAAVIYSKISHMVEVALLSECNLFG